MHSLIIFASLAGIILTVIFAIFIHHGLTHPEEKDFFNRWFDTKDFIESFQLLGKSHGGVVLALTIFLIGVVI